MLPGPCEGLGPIWYWDYADLNRYAEDNDPKMITRRINRDLNGYPDRLHSALRKRPQLGGRPCRRPRRPSPLRILQRPFWTASRP